MKCVLKCRALIHSLENERSILKMNLFISAVEEVFRRKLTVVLLAERRHRRCLRRVNWGII